MMVVPFGQQQSNVFVCTGAWLQIYQVFARLISILCPCLFPQSLPMYCVNILAASMTPIPTLQVIAQVHVLDYSSSN